MTSRTGTDGFTLVEVLLAVCVLSLGGLVIESALLRSAGIVGRSFDEMRLGPWMDEKLWDARRAVAYEIEPAPLNGGGDVVLEGKVYHWSVETTELPMGKDLHEIRLRAWWGDPASPSLIERTVLTGRSAVPDDAPG